MSDNQLKLMMAKLRKPNNQTTNPSTPSLSNQSFNNSSVNFNTPTSTSRPNSFKANSTTNDKPNDKTSVGIGFSSPSLNTSNQVGNNKNQSSQKSQPDFGMDDELEELERQLQELDHVDEDITSQSTKSKPFSNTSITVDGLSVSKPPTISNQSKQTKAKVPSISKSATNESTSISKPSTNNTINAGKIPSLSKFQMNQTNNEKRADPPKTTLNKTLNQDHTSKPSISSNITVNQALLSTSSKPNESSSKIQLNQNDYSKNFELPSQNTQNSSTSTSSLLARFACELAEDETPTNQRQNNPIEVNINHNSSIPINNLSPNDTSSSIRKSCLSRIQSNSSNSKPTQPRRVSFIPSPAPTSRQTLVGESTQALAGNGPPGPAGFYAHLNQRVKYSDLTKPQHPNDRRPEDEEDGPGFSKRLKEMEIERTQMEERHLLSRSGWSNYLHHYNQSDNKELGHDIQSQSIDRILSGEYTDLRVTYLAVVLKSIEYSDSDGEVIFFDPSGRIESTVQQSLIEQYEPYTKPGMVWILQRSTLFNPTKDCYHLVVHQTNLIQVFLAGKKNDGSHQPPIQIRPWHSPDEHSESHSMDQSTILYDLSESNNNGRINNGATTQANDHKWDEFMDFDEFDDLF